MSDVWKALKELLYPRAKSDEERARIAKAGAEEAAKALPEGIIPHEALRKKRREREEMDRMLREADR